MLKAFLTFSNFRHLTSVLEITVDSLKIRKLWLHVGRIVHLIIILAASQLHVLANENDILAACSQ